jgi:hypothetical protein
MQNIKYSFKKIGGISENILLLLRKHTIQK